MGSNTTPYNRAWLLQSRGLEALSASDICKRSLQDTRGPVALSKGSRRPPRHLLLRNLISNAALTQQLDATRRCFSSRQALSTKKRFPSIEKRVSAKTRQMLEITKGGAPDSME